jgi:hypothetical protein
MTDYHAEGVKLLAYVPARYRLPSDFTISPPATCPASDDDRERDLLAVRTRGS